MFSRAQMVGLALLSGVGVFFARTVGAGNIHLFASDVDSPPGGLAVARYFDEKARALPPTEPSASLDFPLHYVERVLWDTGYVLSAPGRWQAGDWLRFSLFAAGTGATMSLDRTIDIESRIRHPRSSTEKSIEDAAEELGDLPGIAGVVGGSALFGLVSGNSLAEDIAGDSGEAVLVSGLMEVSLKEVVGRSRPNRGQGPFQFHPFSGNASMPSGHTTVAFALASAVSERLDNRWWVAPETYALASLVGFSRVRANAHFASDVFVAAAIGTACGRTLVTLERDRESGRTPAQVSVGPLLAAPGLELSLRF